MDISEIFASNRSATVHGVVLVYDLDGKHTCINHMDCESQREDSRYLQNTAHFPNVIA